MISWPKVLVLSTAILLGLMVQSGGLYEFQIRAGEVIRSNRFTGTVQVYTNRGHERRSRWVTLKDDAPGSPSPEE